MDLRVLEMAGAMWFFAKDVCEVLGLRGVPSKHTQRLESEEKRVLRKPAILNGSLQEVFPGTLSAISLITESGLYKLVMRSDKPDAQAFQNWVTQDVLPTLRTQGSYSVSDGVERKGAGEVLSGALTRIPTSKYPPTPL